MRLLTPLVLTVALLGAPAAGKRPAKRPAKRAAPKQTVRKSIAPPADAAEALQRLNALGAAPPLADYRAYFTASVRAAAKDYKAAAAGLDPVWRTQPASPLAGQAALLAARAYLELERPRQALEVLGRNAASLSDVRGLALQAEAQEAAGDRVAAALAWQSVYYGFPNAEEAATAGAALKRLEQALGDEYPPPGARQRFERAEKLTAARRQGDAQSEYQKMLAALGGAERQTARVRLAALDYQARKTDAALAALRALALDDEAAEAERLYWITACLRRLERESEMLRAVDELAREHAQSPWRLKALNVAATLFLVDNRPEGYVPLYRACADGFPNAPEAAACHWWVAWRAYFERKPEAKALLWEHPRRFPASEKAGAALYYLARLAEQDQEEPAARRLYQELGLRFPNYYYTTLARERLKQAGLARAAASEATHQALAKIAWPERAKPVFAAGAESKQRIARARLLDRAGLALYAEGELRYGVRNGGEAYPLAMELAEQAAQRGDTARGLRLLKASLPGYLFLARDAAPRRFWQLAFPLPFRGLIETHAAARQLDTFLLAALIRQESEFDPLAVSPVKAVGLTQVMPATGRQLARKVGLKRYTAAMLKTPDVNLRLGAYYLRTMIDSFQGRVEPVLASYNAGKSRADRWLTWGPFREPSEFIECIPFQQTREYVQILLRNADLYRWLYQDNHAAP